MTGESMLLSSLAHEVGDLDLLRSAILALAVRGRLVEQREEERLAGDSVEPCGGPTPWELPASWCWATFESVCESRLGKMLDKANNTGKPRLYLRNANVQWFRIDLRDLRELRIEDEDVEKYTLRDGDLLICEGGEPGRAAICGPDDAGLVFQKALHRARPNERVLSNYLLYVLRADTWSGRLSELFTGATIRHLTGRNLAKHLLPIPPVAEQHRIVAKVDELMASVAQLESAHHARDAIRSSARRSTLQALVENGAWDRVRDNWDSLFTTPESVGVLRRTILDLAVRGRLVEQRQEEGTGEDLLPEIMEARAKMIAAAEIRKHSVSSDVSKAEKSLGVPATWTWSRLGLVAAILDHRREPVNEEERARRIEGKPAEALFPYYGATRQQGWIDDYRFDQEVVLLGEDGVPFFDPLRPKAYLVSGACWVNNHAHVLAGIHFSNGFLLHYLNAFDYEGRVPKGATRTKLNQGKMRDIPVPVPPLAEQHRIAAKVDELMALCDDLEARLCEVEEISEKLAKSVVHHVGA